MVQPCRQDPKTTKLTPVFMRNDIIRIVGSGAIVLERSDRAAREKLACNRAVSPIRKFVNARKNLIQIGFTHLALRAEAHAYFRRWIDHQAFTCEEYEMVLGNVIAGGKKEFC